MQPLSWDLDQYRRDAETFLEEIVREYYLQGAGHKRNLEIEPIYERYEPLFLREAVDRIAEARGASSGPDAMRLRYLHQFALDGYLGSITRDLETRIAELEASLEVDVGGETIPYRMAPVVQANTDDADRRAEIEAARNAVLAERLNPLHLEGLERAHTACVELGWPSYLDAYSDVRALDLRALASELERFAESTEAGYASTVDPELEQTLAWILGGVVAAGFFVSSVSHDLAHALVARRRGVDVRSIAVSFFGGATPLDPAKVLELAQAVVNADRFPYLATIDGDQPRLRPVSPVRTDGFTVYVANLQNHNTLRVPAQGRIGGSWNYRGSRGISFWPVGFESCFALALASEKQLAAALEDRTQKSISFAAVIPDPVFPFTRSIGRLGPRKDRN